MPVINPSALPSGNLKGEHHGATISVILDHSPPGHGPRLHEHPYDETWVVIAGNLTFQAGDQQLEGGPGDIVIIPPEAPHKFINHGPTPANLVCIHRTPRSSRSGWNDRPRSPAQAPAGPAYPSHTERRAVEAQPRRGPTSPDQAACHDRRFAKA
jgi:mannose-6-phosphate isomerase-like protein (cupin superfamily)